MDIKLTIFVDSKFVSIMSTYVFLTFAVHGIGGTQIYVRNKLLFLQKRGWDVKVITSESGNNIMVRELAPFANDIVPEIAKNPGLYSKNVREAALMRMVDIVGASGDKVVIESDFMAATLWGEMLAERLKARHLVLLIQENYSIDVPRYQRFWAWKFQRHEFAVNVQDGARKLLHKYCNVPDEADAFLIPACHNVIEEYDATELDALVKKADYHIGSVGRVNKPFVLPMVRSVQSFAEKHPDKCFQLVLFGGSPVSDDITDIYQYRRDNLQIDITGALFPVPRHLIDRMDVFIASAGAARTTYEAGAVTIAIDANDFEPIGIMGEAGCLDSVNRLPGQNCGSIGDLLERVLFTQHPYPKPGIVPYELDRIFQKHIDFLDKMVMAKEYYDIRKTWPSLMSRMKNHIKKYF